MSAFIYWFPKLKLLGAGNVKQIPKECNLDTVLDGADWSPLRWAEGPDKEPGMLAFIEPSPQTGGEQAKINFDLEKQTWVPVENEEGKVTHWIGWEIDNPPTFRDLVRPMLTDGLPLQLNAQPFVVPLATLPECQLSDLPQRFVWRKGGVREEIQDRYASLCLRCKKQFDWMRKREKFEDVDLVDLVMEPYEQFYLAVDLLNVNYRVSGPEVCALELLNSVSIIYVIRYGLGWPYFEAEAKARVPKAEPGNGPAPTTLAAM